MPDVQDCEANDVARQRYTLFRRHDGRRPARADAGVLRQQENNPALKWWGTAYLLGAASVALWTIASGTLGELLSLALERGRLRRLRHGLECRARVPRPQAESARTGRGAVAWIALCAARFPASMLSMIIGARIVSVYAALTASELWSERRKGVRQRWPAFVVPVLHGCVLMLPILLGEAASD